MTDGISSVRFSDTFVVPQCVWSASLGEELVLLHLQTGELMRLNGCTALIWSLLLEGKRGEQVIATLTEVYEVSKGQAEEDVRVVLKRLLRAGMLEESRASSCRERAERNTATSLLSWRKQISRIAQRYHALVWVEAWITLVCVKHWLALSDLFEVIELLERIQAELAPDRDEVHQFARVLLLVADCLGARGEAFVCRHVSLALCWMLRERGKDAQVRVGVYLYPLTMHMWVQWQGQQIFWQTGKLPPGKRVSVEEMAVLAPCAGTAETRQQGSRNQEQIARMQREG